MKEGLMLGCANWGTNKCNKEVAKWKIARKVGEGESIQTLPPVFGEEQKKLDDICKKCPNLKMQPE